MAAVRQGGYQKEADKLHRAAVDFMEFFASFYGKEGRRSLAASYRMAKYEDPKKSLWMGAWRWSPSVW